MTRRVLGRSVGVLGRSVGRSVGVPIHRQTKLRPKVATRSECDHDISEYYVSIGTLYYYTSILLLYNY